MTTWGRLPPWWSGGFGHLISFIFSSVVMHICNILYFNTCHRILYLSNSMSGMTILLYLELYHRGSFVKFLSDLSIILATSPETLSQLSVGLGCFSKLLRLCCGMNKLVWIMMLWGASDRSESSDSSGALLLRLSSTCAADFSAHVSVVLLSLLLFYNCS